MEKEKLFANHLSDLYPEHINNSYNSTKKQSNFRKMSKGLESTFLQRYRNGQFLLHMKRCSIPLVTMDANKNKIALH